MQVVENLLTETVRAVSFLSRLPVPDRYFTGHDGSLSRTVAAFPLAGLIIAFPSALLILILASASAAHRLDCHHLDYGAGHVDRCTP